MTYTLHNSFSCWANMLQVVEPRYYVPGNYDQNVRFHENPHIANAYFCRLMCSRKVYFSRFLLRVFTVPRRKKSRKHFFAGFSLAICIFFQHAARFPRAKRGQQGRTGRWVPVASSMNGRDMLFEWRHVYITAVMTAT